MPASVLVLARTALSRTRTAAGARAFRVALAATSDAVVIEALAPLGDEERFTAMIAVGLLRPAHLEAATAAFLEGLRADRPFRWTDACSGAAVDRWIRVAAPILDADRLVAVLAGRCLEIAVQEKLRLGEIVGARRLHAAISPLDKRDRAGARARIAVASGASADFTAAQQEALCRPVIQDGGEETEALAGALVVWAPVLPADHPAVQLAVETLVRRTTKYVKGNDYSLGIAASVCADTAAPGRAGWLEHARALHEAMVRAEDRIAQHIVAAERRLAGEDAPAPASAPSNVEHPSLDEVGREASFGFRSWRASWIAADALVAGDVARAEAAFMVAFTPPADPPSASERSAWIAARFAAGEPAADALVTLAGDSASARELPEAAWTLAEARLRGDDLTRFVRACLAGGLHRQSLGGSRERSHVETLARMVAAHGDAALAHEMLEAVLAEPVPQGTYYQDAQRRRVEVAVSVLGRQLAPTLTDALEACLVLLATPAMLWCAPELALALADPAARLGEMPVDAGRGVAVAHARAGRWAEALKVATGLGLHVLLALARMSPPPAIAKKIVVAAKKTPKGRGNEATYWRHRLANLHLALGDPAAAIDLLVVLPNSRTSGIGPGALAGEIAVHLDAHGGWDAARATALIETLGSGRVIPQDIPPALLEVLPRAWPHLPDGDARLAPIRAQLARWPRDLAVVEMARADALARVADEAAPRAFAAAVAASERGAGCHLQPWHLLVPLSAHPELPGWDGLWQRAFATFNIQPTWARQGLGGLLPVLSPPARQAVVAMVRHTWPADVEEPLREHALALLAAEVDDEATLAFLLDGAASVSAASGAIVATACAHKRRGEGDADALAELIGLH